MTSFDLNQLVPAASGVQLSIIDALRNATGFLHGTDVECAYVSAACAALDAVMSEIDRQQRQHDRLSDTDIAASVRLCLHDDGAFSVAASGDVNALNDFLRKTGRLLWPNETSASGGQHAEN